MQTVLSRPGADIGRGDMDSGNFVEIQQLGQLLGIVAVVLPFGAEDHFEQSGVSDQDPGRDLRELFEDVAVAGAGFVDDLERLLEASEPVEKLIELADLPSVVNLSVAVEDANSDLFGVEIESDVQHGCLLRTGDRETQHIPRYRPTEASFIGSRRSRRRTEERIGMSQSVRERVRYALNAIFHHRHVEVQQEAERKFAQPKVGEELRLMKRSQLFNGLHFNDE
jgi:hypothetical protein